MTGPRLACGLWIATVLACGSSPAAGQDAEPDDRIGLADLAAYRSALSGRATADDARPAGPPARVAFRDLWEHPETYRGRRVTVVGRLERTFRQGAVGSFPPMAESWIFSSSGDPLCLVYPQPEAPRPDGATGGSSPTPGDHQGRAATNAPSKMPGPGRMVRFTGTFLKTVRYAAGDGERLAPLIVGDRPPEPPRPGETGGDPAAKATGAGDVLRAVGGGDRDHRPAADRLPWSDGSRALGLALASMAALVLAWQHFRGARLRRRAAPRRRPGETEIPDPPLHFVDSPEPG